MSDLSFLAPLQGRRTDAGGSPLVELARAIIDRQGDGDWKISFDDIWCFVQPSGYCMRDQGWKIHVSATRSSAFAVLKQVVEVLVRHGCAFKFASTPDHVTMLNSRHYSRGGAGKFLTIYPESDAQFRQFAEDLDAATAGLPGPEILSDRAYRAGSLVHYRYGGFFGRMVLSNDSDYRPMLKDPDGFLVEDRRDAWFSPPTWAPCPFDEPEAGQTGSMGQQVLLADRFVVREAVRHANKGGVYRATDTQTSAEVIVKEARPYVEADEAGRDIRDSMRNEAEMLDALQPLGVAPRKLALFEQGGHLFLVEDLVSGLPLRRWVAERQSGGPGLPLPLAAMLGRQLAELLGIVHTAQVVVRDFTPNNVIVAPDGQLRLIDLELAARPGTRVPPAGTPGYAAPEQLAGAPVAVEADLFSLGAIIFTLATGSPPLLLDDEPQTRSLQARLDQLLDIMAEHNETAKRLKSLILGLMDPTPERRWELTRTQAFLNDAEQIPTPTTPRAADSNVRRLTAGNQKRLIIDAVEHLLASMSPDRDRLWPSSCFGTTSDPCNVHHGAAGVLAALTQVARLQAGEGAERDSSDLTERVSKALRTACGWIERRLTKEPRLLPGLYFGRSGTAWALFDAARILGDKQIAARAIDFAKRIPVSWPNPDVTHGAAGAGLAQLYLWQATGDDEFAQRALRCAADIVASVERNQTGVIWRVPASFDSRFAGSVHYGFAHGLAGIAWFLLALGLAADQDEYVELAKVAGETLCAAAQRDDGAATWTEGPADEAGGLVYWCHGSSGIGTFLIRLWQATDEERFRAIAEEAAVAVWRTRWQLSSCVCHGLAGSGEFLLDLAAALNEPRYQAEAEELGAVLFARHAYRDGRIVIPDDTGTGLAADYGVGFAGVLAFLLRLRHGGPRMWMADTKRSLLAAVGAGR